MYVEELIGQDTVNTIPPATLDAFRDHGHLARALTENIAGAKKTMETLAQVGISMKEVTDKLTDDGVKLFADAFDKLLEAIEKNALKGNQPEINRQSIKLPEQLAAGVKAAHRMTGVRRARCDGCGSAMPRCGPNTDEAKWLGWLGVTEQQIARVAKLQKLAEDVKSEGFSDMSAAGNGRIESVSGSLGEDFRTHRWFSAAARARFDGSCAGQGV